MQFLLPLTYAILFIFLIQKIKFFSIGELSKLQLIGLFVLKGIAGIIGFYIYTYYYPQSDSYLYLEGSKNIFDQFFGNANSTEVLGWNSNFDDVFYNNSRIIIYINFFIQFISFNDPFVHILFFCFFSFVGLTALYNSFYKYFPTKKSILVLGIYIVPSVLFWTSGVYKEAITMLCVGLIIYTSDFGSAKSYSLKGGVLLILLLILLFFLKLYILASLLPLLLINFCISGMGNKNYVLKFIALFILLVGVFHLVSKTNAKTNFYQLIADKQAKAISEARGGIFLANENNFICLNYNDSSSLAMSQDSSFKIKAGSDYLSWKLDNMKDTSFVTSSLDTNSFKFVYKIKPANSVLGMQKMDPSFLGILENIPMAIANVFFQPTLFKIKNSLQLFAWLENIWLLLLLVLAILFFDKKMIEHKQILVFCIVFAILQFAMIGLVTPAIGAMVRYKVIALPFLFTICLLCIDGEKLSKKLKRTKN